MIEKPKRPKKIANQDNKQPQTIQELIRRYDLNNTKIYDFLDELVSSLQQERIDVEKKLATKANTGTVLFENANGDNGSNFTLNDTISNYKEVKIDYVVAMGGYIINESKRSPITDGNCVSLTCFMAHSNAVQLLDIGRYLASGNTLTRIYETRSRISEDNTAKWDGTSTGIYITKITGYK